MNIDSLSGAADILRNRRKELNLTQDELGERINKKRSYVSRVERGISDMQLSSLIQIAGALGLEVELKTH